MFFSFSGHFTVKISSFYHIYRYYPVKKKKKKEINILVLTKRVGDFLLRVSSITSSNMVPKRESTLSFPFNFTGHFQYHFKYLQSFQIYQFSNLHAMFKPLSCLMHIITFGPVSLCSTSASFALSKPCPAKPYRYCSTYNY